MSPCALLSVRSQIAHARTWQHSSTKTYILTRCTDEGHMQELDVLGVTLLDLYVLMLRTKELHPPIHEFAANQIAEIAMKAAHRWCGLHLGATQALLQLLECPSSDDRAAARGACLNAILNLSMESDDNQVYICDHGLQVRTQIP